MTLPDPTPASATSDASIALSVGLAVVAVLVAPLAGAAGSPTLANVCAAAATLAGVVAFGLAARHTIVSARRTDAATRRTEP